MTNDEPRRGDVLGTYTGRRFYPLDPRPEDLRIEDIAHALAHICRFNGHCSRHYSVAEHSILVAAGVFAETNDKHLALTALLHDASEAYLCDVPRPLKHLPEMAPYREMEARLERVIAERFGTVYPMPDVVRLHDERALMTERRDLVPNAHLTGWTHTPVPPYRHDVSEAAHVWMDQVCDDFLAAFRLYGGAS